MNIKALFAGIEHELYVGKDCMIESVMIHSSQKKKNAVFFARTGENEDGTKYIDEAVSNGAVAVCSQAKIESVLKGITYIYVRDIMDCQAAISAKLFNYPSGRIKVVGVTGTNGKSSFVSIASQLFNALGAKSGRTGTVGTDICTDELYLAHNTTYEPAVYNEILNEAVNQNYNYIFSEVSSQGIALKRIENISFYASVFLNLTKDHLDFHKTMQNYFEAKKQLFVQTSDLNIVNISDTYGRQLSLDLKKSGKHVITFGKDNDADYQIINIKCMLHATSYTLITSDWLRRIEIPLIGEFNIENTLPAVILAVHEGYKIDQIVASLQSLRGVQGRIELISTASSKVYLDYAHTPDALEKVLRVLKGIAKGKIIVVFGCGGNRDVSKRCLMGSIASRYAECAILTSDNPRNEMPAKILSDIMLGFENENYIVIPNRAKAIEFALSTADENDVILIAGKGHEEYQIIKNIEYPFSDRNCVRNYYDKHK